MDDERTLGRPAGRLGLIAGGGDLPLRLAQGRRAIGAETFVLALDGFADPRLKAFPHAVVGLGEIGRAINALKSAGCDAVTFAGLVSRPDFGALRLDWRGAKLLPKALAAATKGDDALLRLVLETFETEGFRIVGAEEAVVGLLAAVGPLGALSPDDEALADIAVAAAVVDALGRLDVGQGAVACRGLVLAVEAQEGTDQMLARVAALPIALRGSAERRAGVLVKRPKPGQERRIDLPTIGVRTLEGAAGAGLAGVAVEAGGALIVDQAVVAAAADRLGLFVVGVAADGFERRR